MAYNGNLKEKTQLANKKRCLISLLIKGCILKQQNATFPLSDGQRFKGMLILIVGKGVGSGHSH